MMIVGYGLAAFADVSQNQNWYTSTEIYVLERKCGELPKYLGRSLMERNFPKAKNVVTLATILFA